MTGLSDDESWGDPRWRRRMGGQGRHTTKPRNMDGNGSGQAWDKTPGMTPCEIYIALWKQGRIYY
uniref:Uncharacterized protein n=1 Tax=Oryza brachyantha TaxID=4533 RepID=J3N822_ORYBR